MVWDNTGQESDAANQNDMTVISKNSLLSELASF
jgi:hypothetical protein